MAHGGNRYSGRTDTAKEIKRRLALGLFKKVVDGGIQGGSLAPGGTAWGGDEVAGEIMEVDAGEIVGSPLEISIRIRTRSHGTHWYTLKLTENM